MIENKFDPTNFELFGTFQSREHLNLNTSKISKKKINLMLKRNMQKMVHINILNSPKGNQKAFSPLVTKI